MPFVNVQFIRDVNLESQLNSSNWWYLYRSIIQLLTFKVVCQYRYMYSSTVQYHLIKHGNAMEYRRRKPVHSLMLSQINIEHLDSHQTILCSYTCRCNLIMSILSLKFDISTYGRCFWLWLFLVAVFSLFILVSLIIPISFSSY